MATPGLIPLSQFGRRPATDAEYAQWLAASTMPGAPADFGGMVLPNPHGIKVSDDTDSGIEPLRLPAGVTLQHGNWHGAMPTDISNPPKAQITTTAAKGAATPPDTLPADFQGFDKAPDTLPANFAAWDAQPAKHDPGWLDREIPLTDHWNATLSGFQSVARGVRDAAKGAAALFDEPQDKTEKAVGALGPAALPVYRTLRAAGHSAEDAAHLANAIHDINQSADPTGTYLKAAQETAGQGAGQALLALGTEGLSKAAPEMSAAAAKVKAAASSETAGKLAASAKVVGASAEELPVIGKVVKAGKKLNKLGDIWNPADATKENVPYAGEVEPPAAIAAPAPEPRAAAPAATPATAPSPAADLERTLNEALGGKPLARNAPIAKRPGVTAVDTSKPAALPDGYTPTESSVLKGYKYDSANETLHAITNGGQHYAHAGITPEQFDAFESASSKGAEWNNLRKAPGVVQVEKNFKPSKPGTIATETGEVIPKAKAGMTTTEIPPELLEKARNLSDFIKQPSAKAAPKAAAGTKTLSNLGSPNEGDLTSLLQKSLDQVQQKKGGVMTSAEPKALLDRWGVDPESFAAGREQTRGMKPEESAAAIKKLTAAYKRGEEIEPVTETRDAQNNLISVDGRSRALAAHKAGIDRIPIIVRRIGASE